MFVSVYQSVAQEKRRQMTMTTAATPMSLMFFPDMETPEAYPVDNRFPSLASQDMLDDQVRQRHPEDGGHSRQ